MFIFLASDVGTLIISIVIMLALLAASYFLFLSIRKTYRKEKEEKQMRIEGVITRSEMNSLISTYIARTGGETVFSLIYVDLDKFDDFAMAFGQKEVKNIIKTVSLIIKDSLPTKTYISRYEGDEFMVFVPQQYGRGEVLEIAESILKSFRNKIRVYEDVEIDLTASIAVAQYPNHGENIKNLLQSLQLSIHHLKKEGGNSLKVYSSDLENEEEEMNYYYQVKRAITEKQFILHYQPIVDLNDNSIYAYEALLRWEHPELGLLTPNKFISVMEQTGDIHWVGLWGLETVVKKQFELREEHGTSPMFALNIGPKQLMNPNIAEEFQNILRKYKADANQFILEIGEFLVFERQPMIFENLTKLKKLNFRLAIDEFGFDLGRFEQLDEMGVEIFKIDTKFIIEDSYNMNRYIEIFMDYAKENNKNVICQGIETEELEKRAVGLGITKMQGYYYAKPQDYVKINIIEYKNVDIENEA